MSTGQEVQARLKALVATALPLAKLKGFGADSEKPTTTGAGGMVIGLWGNPGEAEATLSPLTLHFDHEFQLEFAAREGVKDQAAAIGEMIGAFGAALRADRTLGGTCEWIEAGAPDFEDVSILGSRTIIWATVPVLASYSTVDPLN